MLNIRALLRTIYWFANTFVLLAGAGNAQSFAHALAAIPGSELNETEAAFIEAGFGYTEYSPVFPTLTKTIQRQHAVREKKLSLSLPDGRVVKVPVGYTVMMTDGVGTLFIHAIGTSSTPLVYWVLYEARLDATTDKMQIVRDTVDEAFPGFPPSCSVIDTHGLGFTFDAYLDSDFAAFADYWEYQCVSLERDWAEHFHELPLSTDFRGIHVSNSDTAGRYELKISATNLQTMQYAIKREHSLHMSRGNN